MKRVILFVILFSAIKYSIAQKIEQKQIYANSVAVYQRFTKSDTIYIVSDDTSFIPTYSGKSSIVIPSTNLKAFIMSKGSPIPVIKIKELSRDKSSVTILISNFGAGIDNRNDVINMVYSGGFKLIYKKNRSTGKYTLSKYFQFDI
jgi:hypothetical protein